MRIVIYTQISRTLYPDNLDFTEIETAGQEQLAAVRRTGATTVVDFAGKGADTAFNMPALWYVQDDTGKTDIGLDCQV